jgi:hypothetical protein
MRSLFRWLPARGWKRWLALAALAGGALFLGLVLLVAGVFLAFQSPRVQSWAMGKAILLVPAPPEDLPGFPGLKPVYAGPLASAAAVAGAGDIYRPTNVWTVHFKFTAPQWKNIAFKRVPAVPGWMQADGSVILRNANASRNGLAGTLGFDFPWSAADVELGGRGFTNVGVRFKGNGSFLSAVHSYRKPWKLDLERNAKEQSFGGRSRFNFGNLSADFSLLSDTLAYEFHRAAGGPAPRTAFARVFLSIEGQETNRLLGPYVMVENPDAEWAREQLGVKGVALFKPVTYELFNDLGADWTNYHAIYDPKTKTTPAQRQRVIDFARLHTQASDAEFAAQVGNFLDLDGAARFVAVEVLLANFDGLLGQGQNFLLSLDPRTDRFGFVPWDLDHAWGEFPHMGTPGQRERLDVWHPWVEPNRFLARLFAVEAFRARYRAELERLLATWFVPERLARRIDELAAAARPLAAEWSTNRLAKFEQAVGAEPVVREGAENSNPFSGDGAVWQLKHYVTVRAESVRAQLDGRETGAVVTRKSTAE